MAAPTLLFCIGATKAGTSWLHRYVSNHDDCHMRGIKELHYFDAVEFDDWAPWIADVAGRRDANRRQLDGLGPEERIAKETVADDCDDWLRVLEARAEDDAAYLDYLTRGRTTERLVGDFTPAYGLLPEDRLRHMAGLLPDVRFVYILRDPVQRIWSHARMLARRRASDPSEIQPRSVNILKRILKGKEPEVVRRSDYIGPVTRLRNAVAPEKLYFGFYEDLFRRETVAEVSRFLGIGHGWADFGKRVMAGPRARMEPGQWHDMREFLAPQYDAMRAMFDRLPAAWDSEPMKV